MAYMPTNSSTEQNDPLYASDVDLTEQASMSTSKLKNHKSAIWLICLYIPLLVVPWVLTVVLSYRPLSKSTYYHVKGFEYEEFELMKSWVTAIDVLNSIASLMAVPVVSFVIAQIAVIFSQTRASERQLSVRDIFALADRAWTDISVLLKFIRVEGKGSKAFNGFMALATGSLLISALQPPLYQILVDWSSINIPARSSGRSMPHSGPASEPNIIYIGKDLEPAEMEVVPHITVLQRVQSDLPSLKLKDPETYMWVDYNGTQPPVRSLRGEAINSLNYALHHESYQSDEILPAFIAGLPYNSTTGTERYHAMRFNSSIKCELVNEDQFPANCAGKKPFDTYTQVQNDTSSTEFRVCMPGEWGKFPWTLSRTRQDVEEEAYMQLLIHSEHNTSSTFHCSSVSTRGTFELGNYRTGGQYGPLMTHWPSPDVMERDFNDLTTTCEKELEPSWCVRYGYYAPRDWDTNRYLIGGWPSRVPEDMRLNASSPLMTSVMALFGNDSWIRTATNLYSMKANSSNENETAPASLLWKPFCKTQPLYQSFREIECRPENEPSETVARWFDTFFATQGNNPKNMEDLLYAGMVLTHKAILLVQYESDAPNGLYYGGRKIYSSYGFSILKPEISFASIIVISVLLLAQVTGLVFCGIYIARVPTWTRNFNAMAIARIGAGLDKDKLPADGQYAEDEDYERLRNVELPLSMASADALRWRSKPLPDETSG